jgi:antitoxin (DNA-binding transcriptional repressor) of toxin-antitoxin stability system
MEKYADAVAKGKSFVVVKRSKPMFRISPADEMGWEQVIDFTKIRRGGVFIDDLLKRL